MEMTQSRPTINAIYAAAGFSLFLGLWQWAGKSAVAGPVLPAVSDVAITLFSHENFPLLTRSALATLSSAAKGLLLGGSLAVLLAIVMRLLPPLQPGLDRLALLINATPPIALGPILIVVFSRSQTPTVLAGIQVFFLLYVAASSGMAAASPTLRDVMTAFGASRWKRLVHLELPSALPHLAGGLKAVVSASFIGAILGEWFGAPQGLGLVILNAMQNFQIRLMWAAVTMAAAISLTGFLLAAALEKALARRFSPWGFSQ
jgi:ABC-type nitrate/sulfonate/bicarbonate transport system permease component